MKKIIVPLLCIGLTVTQCEYNNVSICYHGKVIMSSCCTGSTFININSRFVVGKKTTLNGQDYPNVIQVPGYLNQGDVYMNLRIFNPDKDFNLFPPIRCLCLIVVVEDVPVFVATAISYASCP